MNRFRKSRVAGYVDLDRSERRIQTHMLAALFAGLLLGGIVEMLDVVLPPAVYVVCDPYAFFVLVLVMGRLGLGFGWALANSVLATFGTLVAEMVGSVMVHGESPLSLGQGGSGLNTLLFLLVLTGLLAYGTRRVDLWGDLAAGALGTVLLGNIVDDLGRWQKTASFSGWQWSLLASGLIALACVIALRPSLPCRVRAVGVGVMIAVPYLFFVL